MSIAYDLTGTTALITGAVGTLGRAQAHAFAASGIRVLLLDRPENDESGAQLAAMLGNADFLGVDLNDIAGAEAAVRNRAKQEPIHFLLNNAAMIINKPFEDFSLDEYESQVRTNSSAAFALTRAVAPGMKKRHYGKIINYCSVTLNGRWDGYVPYVASKGAILGLTKSLARELGAHGIRVNAISPGAVVSEAEARVFADRLQQYNDWIIENQCLKERIQPEAVAKLALFLVSPESDLITGQNIHVDGGW